MAITQNPMEQEGISPLPDWSERVLSLGAIEKRRFSLGRCSAFAVKPAGNEAEEGDKHLPGRPKVQVSELPGSELPPILTRRGGTENPQDSRTFCAPTAPPERLPRPSIYVQFKSS
jgi:hypothetical protein